jgi:hypothetical protein
LRLTGTAAGLWDIGEAGTGQTGRTGNFEIVPNNGGSPAFSILQAGQVGIGTTSPTTALQVNGTITPNTDNSGTLGNSTYRWNAVYATNGTIQTSDERLKKNIEALDASSSLSELLALNPVSFNWKDETAGTSTQLGFIAQEVQPILPETVVTGDDASSTLGLRYTEFIPVVVSAFQSMYRELSALEDTVAGFALNFVSAHVTATVGDFDRVNTKELCADKSDGTQVCVTGDQLATVLAQATGSNAAGQGGASDSSSSAASTTAPIVEVNGANPAVISVGDNYADMGATITGPSADLNLGIKTFLNGALVSNIVIDTAAVATDTIDYVVTDQNGLTSTSTRTVIIQPVQPAPTVEAVVATSSPTIADQTASSTPAQ